MVWYLMLSWASFVIFVALIIIKKFVKRKKIQDLYGRVAGFFLILMIFFFGIALATDDPVTDVLSVPSQLLITAVAGAFALWKYYFDPVKERVIKAEKDIVLLNSEMKSNFSSIREDLRMIKDAIFQKK